MGPRCIGSSERLEERRTLDCKASTLTTAVRLSKELVQVYSFSIEFKLTSLQHSYEPYHAKMCLRRFFIR